MDNKNNIQSFQEFIINILNKISYPLTILSLIISLYLLYQIKVADSELNSKLSRLQDTVYLSLMYDIFKQGEKFKKDKKDIKREDLSKFMHFCTKKDENFMTFIKKQNGDNSFRVDTICKKIKKEFEELK